MVGQVDIDRGDEFADAPEATFPDHIVGESVAFLTTLTVGITPTRQKLHAELHSAASF
jgi:hypothetical protein